MMTARSWVLWCGTADEIDQQLAAGLIAAAAAGELVRVAAFHSGPSHLGDIPVHRISRIPSPVQRLPLRIRQRWGLAVLRRNEWTCQAATNDYHLVVGSAKPYLSTVRRFTADRVIGGSEARTLLRESQLWRQLDRLLQDVADQPERTRIRPDKLLGIVQVLNDSNLPGENKVARHCAPQRLAALRTVARRMIRQQQYEQALELLELAVDVWDPGCSTGLPALLKHAQLSSSGTVMNGLEADAAGALDGADRALEAGDLPGTAELIDIGAGLLLHRDLHADTLQSPLVEDPETFLAPLRSSRAMTALAAPLGRPPRAVAPPTSPLRVVVLTGAYPRFARPMVAALREHGHHVEEIDLGARHPPFRWLGTDPDQVRRRLQFGSTHSMRPADADGYDVPEHFLRWVLQADVVVADWADKAAVWLSLVASPSSRVVIRVHGMDAMSLWPHAINWSRIAAVVAVSPHQANLLDNVLRHSAVSQAGASYPRCQVVPNIVSPPTVSVPAQREPLTLGLIGWGKRVKDPLWAVEVLAGLRDRGGAWRLVLVGEGLATGSLQSGQDYARRFHQRAQESDVAGAIEYVPQTDAVALEIARLGFILSSSLRESFHLGLVEGVFGGAVPVVRDWPFFSSQNGARRLFPPDWVVPDVAAAVDRIWDLRDPNARREEAAAAQKEAMARFNPERTARELVRVIVGG